MDLCRNVFSHEPVVNVKEVNVNNISHDNTDCVHNYRNGEVPLEGGLIRVLGEVQCTVYEQDPHNTKTHASAEVHELAAVHLEDCFCFAYH